MIAVELHSVNQMSLITPVDEVLWMMILTWINFLLCHWFALMLLRDLEYDLVNQLYEVKKSTTLIEK